jgi:hypothetical protein
MWMKGEVGFKPFFLRSFAFLGLLVENGQMLRGLALVGRMRVAPTPVTKLSFLKLGLCGAFPPVQVSRLFVPLVLSFTIELRWLAIGSPIEIASMRDIHMNFRERLGTNRTLRAILSK